jgi:hypothetical protein
MEPVVGAMTVRVAEEEVIPLTEAVIVSVPAQPLSRYEAVATPFTVVTLAVRTALPLLAQAEVKLIACGVVRGTPLLDTVTATLVVPKDESGFVPKAGVLMETDAAPTE